MHPDQPKDDDTAARMRRRRGVLLVVLFVVALVVDFGIWVGDAMCDNCGGPAGVGQKFAFIVSGGIAALMGCALLWRRRKTTGTVLLMVAAILLLRWLLIVGR